MMYVFRKKSWVLLPTCSAVIKNGEDVIVDFLQYSKGGRYEETMNGRLNKSSYNHFLVTSIAPQYRPGNI